jgi:hypothetical protein
MACGDLTAALEPLTEARTLATPAGPASHLRSFATNDLAWALLEGGQSQSARPLFQELVLLWNDAPDFKRYWPRLGDALCDALSGGGFERVDDVMRSLLALLGEQHPRVAVARSRRERVEHAWVERAAVRDT